MGSFCVGDDVEVIGHEDGFKGSYYEAKIIKQTEKEDEFLIEYKTLIEEGVLIQEPVNSKYIRPCPPKIQVSNFFKINDVVDVEANDGWWIGRVIQAFPNRNKFTGTDKSKYYVGFTGSDSTLEVIKYSCNELRVHQDWDEDNGRWVKNQEQNKKRRRFVVDNDDDDDDDDDDDEDEDEDSSVLEQQESMKRVHREEEPFSISWIVESY